MCILNWGRCGFLVLLFFNALFFKNRASAPKNLKKFDKQQLEQKNQCEFFHILRGLRS